MGKTMKQLLLNIYMWSMFFIVTVLAIAIIPWVAILYVVFFRRTLSWATRWAICIYGWILVIAVPFFAPLTVESRTGKLSLPVIMVANHTSAIDAYLFGALLHNASFVTTWAFKIPVYGIFMRLAQYINADEGWNKVCEKGIRLLAEGTSIIIWPEGHRSRDGRLGRFKNGAFALAVKTGRPLLPVCIVGSGKFLTPGKSYLAPSRVKMILLDPVYPDMQNDPQEEIIRLRNTVHGVIAGALQAENKPFPAIPYSNGLEKGEKC
jgi:1-acyl-sn-glycerol-3-phosphate acyltransferase